MRSHERTTGRPGFTLAELVVSMVGASVLLIGLSSAMFIAIQSSDSSLTPAEASLEGHAILTDMRAELQCAQTVTEQTATAITFTVPDRDDPDTSPETIRYAWTGTPGDPLSRAYNGGAAANVAEDVFSFNVVYIQSGGAIEYLNVKLQISSDARAAVETGIPLLNRP